MTLDIDKGIPVAPHPIHRPKYPFRRMEVGDSFALPLRGRDPARVQQNVHGAARTAGVKIKTRTMGDELRVWLVAETRGAA